MKMHDTCCDVRAVPSGRVYRPFPASGPVRMLIVTDQRPPLPRSRTKVGRECSALPADEAYAPQYLLYRHAVTHEVLPVRYQYLP